LGLGHAIGCRHFDFRPPGRRSSGLRDLTLLERTKTTPVAHFIATPPVRIAISIAPAETPLPVHERLTDSEGLHLKIRVLLI
jgi:hypothetical protein